MKPTLVALIAWLAAGAVAAAEPPEPAAAAEPPVAVAESLPTLESATMPSLPVSAVGGGEVRLDLALTPNGSVSGVTILRDTPPFTDALVAVVGAWQFDVPSGGTQEAPHALVVGLFRPPDFGSQLAPAQDQEQDETGSDVPQLVTTSVPALPPGIVQDTAVVLEVDLSPDGQTEGVRTVVGEAPFGEAAAQSVQGWSFRPPGHPSRVWVVVGFRSPIVVPAVPADDASTDVTSTP